MIVKGFIFLMSFLLFGSGETKMLQVDKGFLSIPWGSSMKKASKELSKRKLHSLEFKHSSIFAKSGTFGSTDVEHWSISFYNDSMYQASVNFFPPEQTVKSLYATYDKLVKSIATSYGAPTSSFYPKEFPSDSILTPTRNEPLYLVLQNNKLYPSANWKIAHKADNSSYEAGIGFTDGRDHHDSVYLNFSTTNWKIYSQSMRNAIPPLNGNTLK